MEIARASDEHDGPARFTDRPLAPVPHGAAINLGNPKVIVFFLALLPTVVDLGALNPLGFLELALTIAVIASGVLTTYALAAARARRLFTSPRPLASPIAGVLS